MNNGNIQLNNVLASFSAISPDGDLNEYGFEIDEALDLKAHIQGMDLWNQYMLFTHNVEPPDAGYLAVVNKTDLATGVYYIEISGFSHPGGIQVVGDVAVVPLEPSEPDNSKSIVLFYDLTTITDTTGPTQFGYNIPRSTGAACAGMAVVNNQNYVLAVYTSNGKIIDIYQSNGLDFNAQGFEFTYQYTYDPPFGYDNIALVVDTSDQLFLIGLRGEQENNWATIYDFADLYSFDEAYANPSIIVSGRHLTTTSSGNPIPQLRPHFRWGATAPVVSPDTLNIICSRRHFNLPGNLPFQANTFDQNPLPSSWVMHNNDNYVACGDIDGDNQAEIVINNPNTFISIVRGDGGELTATWIVQYQIGGWEMHNNDIYFACGDVDGDNEDEIIVKNPANGYIAIIHGTDGVLSSSGIVQGSIGGWDIHSNDTFIACGDIDGDGQEEVFVSNPNTYVAIIHGSGGNLSSSGIVQGSIGGWDIHSNDVFIACGDVDDDGEDELFVSNPNTYVAIIHGSGGNLSSSGIVQGSIGGWDIHSNDTFIACGDIDGDGQEEVFVSNPNTYVAIIHGTDGVLSSSGIVQGSIGGWDIHSNDTFIACGDIDGDGEDEIIVTNPNGYIAIIHGSGGNLSSSGMVQGSIGGWDIHSNDILLPCGDVDGDGEDEVVIRNPNGYIAILHGSGGNLSVTGIVQEDIQ